jgi:hypothetical protein
MVHSQAQLAQGSKGVERKVVHNNFAGAFENTDRYHGRKIDFVNANRTNRAKSYKKHKKQ